MTALIADLLRKSFGKQPVLRGLSFRVEPGAFTFLLGPSGCGKTTALRLIAGLEEPDGGTITLFGEKANDPRSRLPPAARGIGMVFQHDALWPHMTVAGHLRYALHRRTARGEREREARRLLDLVRLAGMEGRLPSTLSGGERQRLSLARALAARPRLMLLDEPTRNLDRPLARPLRREFARVLREEGVAVLYVTHDHEEAFSLADRLVLMDEGVTIAEGSPEELYLRPPDARAARLLGLTATVHGVAGADGEARTPVGAFPSRLAPGTPFVAFFRPEDFQVGSGQEGEPALVRGSRFLGAEREIDLEIGGLEFRARFSPEVDPPPGSTIRVVARRAPATFEERAR
ncbi:MAG: ABC transporter ATP-binding protein [Planctomycetes bacterium]|nr:ABC transporter ATP-binding protein [Planctomycetota bacterium]